MAIRAMDQTLFAPTNTNGHADVTSTFVNGDGDDLLDAMEVDAQDGGLDFDNSEHPPDLLLALGTLRRQNQFCDAVLRVDEREVGA